MLQLQRKSKRFWAGIGLFLIFSLSTIIVGIHKKADAAGFCQPPIYIGNRFNIQGQRAPFAEQWGPVLERNGFRQVDFPPQPGDVVIRQSGVLGAFQGGHIGVVEGVRQIRSTNQPGSHFTEFGCNNVSLWTPRASMNPRNLGSGVTFWRR